ncbi:MAG: response regulator transcription factor [Lachnospiraceae bacterium]|nr:response regulator transcription factor [Lachnospiraceae bacterium]
MIKIVVCDDEKKILNTLSEKISQTFLNKDMEIEIFETTSPTEALEYIKSNVVDVVFLDIDMPILSGMDIAESLLNEEYKGLLIFVTSHDSLVYSSFKYHPFGFIRKSYFDDEIEEVISRIIDEISHRDCIFTYKTNDGIYRVNISEIVYFESESNYLLIHLTDKVHKFRGTMSQLEMELSENGFIRVQKGFLVNQKYIEIIRKDEIVMSDNTIISISRTNKEVIKEKIMRYMR